MADPPRTNEPMGDHYEEGRTVTRVAVIDDYQYVAESMLDWSKELPEVEIDFFHEAFADEDDVAAQLHDYRIIVTRRERTPFPRSLIARLPNLEMIVTTGAQNPAIDNGAAKELGILVCGGTGGSGLDPSEMTWGLILALLRNIPQEDRATREGAWGLTLGMGLAGRTLGIVGLGRLGSAVARVGRAFEMRVIAWGRNLDDERAAEAGATKVDWDTLFEDSHVVTTHLRMAEETRHIIGRREFSLMRDDAIFVNTSRGKIVDEEALVDALRSGRIAGAALDVFTNEPLPSHSPLLTMPNTVITPHIGGVTVGTYRNMYGIVAECIAAHLYGPEPIRVLNP